MELLRTDLAEQAEELAAERALRVAPHRLGLHLEAGKLPAPLLHVCREGRCRVLDDRGGGERRVENGAFDARHEDGPAGAGEVGEAVERSEAGRTRAPDSVRVTAAERGGVGVDDDVPGRSGERPPAVVDDCSAGPEQVDRPEGLPVRRFRVLLPVQHLDRPGAQQEQ